jgi:hypothetical protein
MFFCPANPKEHHSKIDREYGVENYHETPLKDFYIGVIEGLYLMYLA